MDLEKRRKELETARERALGQFYTIEGQLQLIKELLSEQPVPATPEKEPEPRAELDS